MYLKSITLKNTRCIRQARLDLRYPGDSKPGLNNINLILGANGSGKSTILQAAATAVLKPIAQELAVEGVTPRLALRSSTAASISCLTSSRRVTQRPRWPTSSV